MSFAIPVAFLILATILLWFIIYLKGKLWIKLIFIGITSYYCIVLWYSLSTFAGWPSNNELPDEFQVRWIIVVEPNKKTGDVGAIYMWISDIEGKEESRNFLNFLGYNAKKGEPRSFKVGYSRGLHKRAVDALGLLKKGFPVKGTRGLQNKESNRGPSRERRGPSRGPSRGPGSFSQEQEIIFHILPPPKMPRKH